MKTLAVEFEGIGITINGVSSDMTEARFLDSLLALMMEEYKKEPAP